MIREAISLVVIKHAFWQDRSDLFFEVHPPVFLDSCLAHFGLELLR